MEKQRLKNIIILILALLNLFLLVLLLNFHWQRNSAQQRLSEQIYTLYEANGLALAEEDRLSLEQAAPHSLSLQRSAEQEAAIAAWLLEEESEGIHQGGGIYTYRGKNGTLTFRSNGAFDYVPSSHSISSPTEFCESFCEEFGYTLTQKEFSAGSGSVLAQRNVDGIAVYNGMLSFLFEDGKLVSLSGICLSTLDSTAREDDGFSAADALVKFLDYRNTSGTVCNAVTGVRQVYEFRASGQILSLVSMWEVSTDTYRYYVDCLSGAITRA
ncbi:MAG: hypothetical protein E7442_09410 [Ruminococcaceae bacterium]|nr:hypothetical protein [Oscillospiraceae bacterium]